MKLHLLSCLLVAVVLTACASQPASQQEEGEAKLVLTPEAKELVEEKGKVEAAKAGTKEARKADLVCESVKRTGSHMTETYCYSRREADRTRDRVEQQLRNVPRGGARAGDN